MQPARKPFLEALSTGLLGDGGIGTEVFARLGKRVRCCEELNLTDPKLIRSIHRDFLKAGSDFLETNTFRASRPALKRNGLEKEIKEINRAGVTIAKDVAGSKAYVAGSVGPAAPPGSKTKEFFLEQIDILIEASVDLIILETFTDLKQLKLAVDAARQLSKKIPLVAQFSTHFEKGRGFMGINPEKACKKMSDWDVDLIGLNCCNGPEAVLKAIRLMAPLAQKPLSAFPNAGLPIVTEGGLVYDLNPPVMAKYARLLFQAGAKLVGGCCGVTPEMIQAMKKAL